ncbi:hypothetical protein WMY93_005985 [Mugilogobius chulae]|uniref:Scaffolding anchor of CK1 domain-containing protein n=1 Tax=Mugilogobius chulae TaxID=88201 RepID=A0AAW0PJC0_9GOBI
MALSQVQCLDDHHVNWRVTESKPEFFYSEDQRLAVETLINSGRDAFVDFIKAHGVRSFLSDMELDTIESYVELYRPGHEHFRPDTPMTPGPGNLTPGTPGDDEFSVAELDLGWPEASSYRGVTRVNVYTQPPSDGQTHIKEVVRKSIASAQKVIAVGHGRFHRRGYLSGPAGCFLQTQNPVYIIIDTASVPCFLSMCGRADMHRGHLKNLRVRSCGGVEFLTRSAQKVRGAMKEKFLLADGDRAISGSYSYTWSAARLDRNVITVITGQAVETFDMQFRELYLLSRGVSLNKIQMADEPILILFHTPPSPRLCGCGPQTHQPQVCSGGYRGAAFASRISASGKGVFDSVSSHVARAGSSSDVIGFINIRDEKRAHQVHLQRSERFETSQAIRFSSPLPAPAKTEEKIAPTPAQNVQNVEKPKNTEVKVEREVQTLTSTSNDQVDGKEEPEKIQKDNEKPKLDVPKEKTVAENQQLKDITNQEVESQNVAPPVPSREERGSVEDNEEGSQDSTKVICDRGASEDPSSNSTGSEEEFYDARAEQQKEAHVNGVTVGSNQGNRQGDGLNVMARFSQSMLDLREPTHSEDSMALIRQSQQMRRQNFPSPHRNIGQNLQDNVKISSLSRIGDTKSNASENLLMLRS